MHILFHRSTPWTSDVQCSTKTYASLFSGFGYEVTYLQDLIHLGHYFSRRGYYKTWKQGSRHEGKIWVAATCATVPALSKLTKFSPRLAIANYKSCVPSINTIVGQSGFESPRIIWSTKPGSAQLRKIFPGSKLIMNVVDYYPAFHGDAIKRLEEHDYKLADHVFVIGQTLRKYLRDELGVADEKITVLGQGVAIDRYKSKPELPKDMNGIPGPIAIWVGVMNKADQELMEAAANTMAELGGSMVLIGPPGDWEQESMQRHANIHFLGPKPSEQVPAYLLHSDIGLMLYDRTKQQVYRGQNPLKLIEYFAAGLAVLSTHHDEFEFLKPPVELINKPRDVGIAIRKVRKDPKSLSENAKQFAATRSWEQVGRNAETIIKQLVAQ